MKIGFYSPYIDSFGGGERYVFTLASHWSKTHDVDIFWDNPADIQTAGARFGLDLSSIHVVLNLFRQGNLFQKLIKTRQYDCIFFLSDGSVPTSVAKRNILHFQVP